MKTKKPLRGRPPKKTSDKQSVRLRANYTPSEAKMIERAAETHGMQVSEWLREVSLHAAQHSPN